MKWVATPLEIGTNRDSETGRWSPSGPAGLLSPPSPGETIRVERSSLLNRMNRRPPVRHESPCNRQGDTHKGVFADLPQQVILVAGRP